MEWRRRGTKAIVSNESSGLEIGMQCKVGRNKGGIAATICMPDERLPTTRARTATLRADIRYSFRCRHLQAVRAKMTALRPELLYAATHDATIQHPRANPPAPPIRPPIPTTATTMESATYTNDAKFLAPPYRCIARGDGRPPPGK